MGEWGNENHNHWRGFVDENKSNGTIIAIFGPTGSGKSVARDTFVNSDNGWEKIVSYTTRPPRPATSEEEKKEYDFISQENFEELNDNEKLINVNRSYAGNSYGIDKEAVRDAHRAVVITDKTSIPQLRRELKALGKKVMTLYVTASPEALLRRQERRLEKGEYETEEQLQQRMEELKKEIKKEYKVKSLADYIIMEDDIRATIAQATKLAAQL